MYTGTLIDDLIATVERANEHAYTQVNSQGRETGVLLHARAPQN